MRKAFSGNVRGFNYKIWGAFGFGRKNAKKLSVAVNMTMVYLCYEAGRMIVEEEQSGKERAAYGKYILKELSQRLTQKFGRGYSLTII